MGQALDRSSEFFHLGEISSPTTVFSLLLTTEDRKLGKLVVPEMNRKCTYVNFKILWSQSASFSLGKWTCC